MRETKSTLFFKVAGLYRFCSCSWANACIAYLAVRSCDEYSTTSTSRPQPEKISASSAFTHIGDSTIVSSSAATFFNAMTACRPLFST